MKTSQQNMFVFFSKFNSIIFLKTSKNIYCSLLPRYYFSKSIQRFVKPEYEFFFNFQEKSLKKL